MFRKQQLQQHKNLLLLLALVLSSIYPCLGGSWGMLSQLGQHMDTSCTKEQNCERQVNEDFLRHMESSMNTTADPCANWFNYICGNWKPPSSNVNLTSAFLEDLNIYNTKIYDVFEKLRADANAYTKLNTAYQKALHYYTSCRDLKDYNVRNMLQELAQGVGTQWPIYENRKSLPFNLDNFVWWKMFAELQSHGLSDMFFTMSFELDKNKILRITMTHYVQQSKLNITNDILDAMGNYTNIQKKLLKWRLENFEKILYSFYEGETLDTEEVVEATKPDDFSTEDETTAADDAEETAEISIKELQRQLPGVKWREYFQILLRNTGITIRSSKKMFEIDETYARNVIHFLNKSSRETVALYMLAKVLMTLNKMQFDKPTVSEQGKNCVTSLRENSVLITNQLYEEHYYAGIRADNDYVVNNLFQRLKAKLNDLIRDNNIGLTDSEIEQLVLKNNKMRLIIGDAATNKTIELLEKYYANVDINDSTNFYHNHLELMKSKFILGFREAKIFDDELYLPFSDTSPYYYIPTNTVYNGYALMQLPAFHYRFHEVFQFARLGFILGHEIMHAFDPTGIHYDSDGDDNGAFGQLLNHKRFARNGGDCLSKEKTKSIDERFADVAGIRLVMETFFNDPTVKTSKYHTHSTKLTNHQLFFIAQAQFYCEKLGSEQMDEEHDTNELRAVYTLAKTREFAHAFKCEQETVMRPKEFCQIW